MHFSFNGHITLEDKARSDYFYVPFDLPAPARRLTVRYRYSDRISATTPRGGNVIDLGIFDPRGKEFPGGPGFRGWSGSDRAEFTIAADEATPGYLPGPLPAGRYHVILGLYNITARGADYEVQVDVEQEAGDAALRPGSGAAQPAQSAGVADIRTSFLWLQGDLHSHTDHSDGRGSPAVLVAKARGLGLDYLAITDHNSTSAHALFPTLDTGDLVLIPGQEATSYYGHMNIWGTSRWCDFRCRTDAEMSAVIDLAHRSGAMCSVNHPRSGDLGWGYSLDLPIETFEVWNGPWPNHNLENLILWDEMLRAGRRLPAVGGSDYHCPLGEETGFVRLGQPATWVKAAGRSAGAVLDGLRAGRACVSAYPAGSRLDISASSASGSAEMGGSLPVRAGEPARVKVEAAGGAGCILRIFTEAGLACEKTLDSSPAVVEIETTATRFARAELCRDFPPEWLPPNAPAGLDLHDWRFAISNPVYFIETQ